MEIGMKGFGIGLVTRSEDMVFFKKLYKGRKLHYGNAKEQMDNGSPGVQF
jgi:hypothetical protein